MQKMEADKWEIRNWNEEFPDNLYSIYPFNKFEYIVSHLTHIICQYQEQRKTISLGAFILQGNESSPVPLDTYIRELFPLRKKP